MAQGVQQRQGAMIERILGLAGSNGEDETGAKFVAFRQFLFLHMGITSVISIHGLVALEQQASLHPRLHLVVWTLATLACVAGAAKQWSRTAAAVLAGLVLIDMALVFPIGSNHSFVELLCLTAVAWLNPADTDERRLLGQGLGWLFVIVLFYSGLQKVLYGTYFNASMLGYLVAVEENFASVFKFLMPAEELLRLQAMGDLPEGWNVPLPDGSYAIQSWPAILASNAVYLLEMGLAVCLLIRRVRPAAVAGVILLVVAIESAAREMTFGFLMLNLVLLFTRENWISRLMPWYVFVYLLLLAASVGIIGGFHFVV